ncbi:tRNA (N(6)-L-threonylcarbamoyladenosine(37)-C(2))-methylthiotransferase MtaB [Mobilitalea sibirica]|uniref:Threonylcarbamoyladenosine tRNA methylthiotransferase MtaB n=1 Tax=Mobilitalea sibirica TaxID=1462919 RepID=A0A8J7H162_9FIRM|nr:tRNA (N(6)-L-threonylcarbamoyladenosine(37)-C(2))-methylthiotransferase MtaB [Mobilitalea sibirica]MBH1939765.1 tRNA (N(6)-L-threonylcarbamoyladenosine(37)-C(2))-methylthiotransferase MtaB [Mobilitalea sibirica]
MKKTAAFLTLGCKVNTYETEAMRGMFEAAGYEIVDFKELADVYVINTCTVTNIADRKSRQMLHQAKKRNPKAIIAAVGCYVQAAEQELLADSAVDIVVGNNKKSDIVTMVERFYMSKHKEELVTDINRENEYEELHVITTMEKTRAFIKIQDGCNRFCSYCIIPYVRGRVRSRGMDDILSEITSLTKKGYKEFVLTGIHISSYGTDFTEFIHEKDGNEDIDDDKTRIPLAQLILLISQIPGIERIRLGSLEPGIITEDFVNAVSGVEQFCPHFHLSLQSGSDTVLKRMNRKYTAREYFDKVELLKKFFEQPAFTTDVIVGFPGETHEEFEETLDFVKKIGFSQIHVFKYSKRAGTKAANMSGQISEEIKGIRSNKLITIANKMSKEYKSSFMGKIEKILIEEDLMIDGRTYQVGHNERYLKMAINCDENLSNQIVNAKVTSYLKDDILLCEITH